MGAVAYGGLLAGKIVFCTGVSLSDPFDFLPIKPVKGEILEVQGQLGFETIVNRGVFIVPHGDDNYRIGSTYNWKEINTELTEKAENELMTKLSALITNDVQIIGGRAGIRPTTPDRHPMIGIHPEKPEVGVFNGFGTKGVSLTPYYANHFYRSLEKGENLDPEVNIDRYFSLS